MIIVPSNTCPRLTTAGFVIFCGEEENDVSCLHMPILNMTHDAIRSMIHRISPLNDHQRQAVYDLVMHLNQEDEWYPDRFHKGMKTLQQNGVMTEFDRKAVEKALFPDHAW